MAATIQIAERNGATPGVESLAPGNLNMGSSDGSGIDINAHTVTAQANGASYEKWFRLLVSAMGGSSQIDNVKIWLSSLGGGYLTGEAIMCNLLTSGYLSSSYPAAPVKTRSTIAINAMPTSQPGSANLGIGGALSGQIITAPNYTDYAVMQLWVTASTPAGLTNSKTLSIAWDEQ